MSLTLDHDFQTDGSLTARVGPTPTCVRAGATATYWDSAGVLQTASANAPIFEYDPVTLLPRGWRIFEGRTNLLVQSEDFETSWFGWIGGVTITANDAVAPDGNTTATKMARIDGLDGQRQDVTLSTSTSYVYSCFMQWGDANQSRLGVYDVDGAEWHASLEIDWTSGVPSTNGSTGASRITYEQIGTAGNWYRISFVFTSDATNTNHRFIIIPENNGSGTEYIHVWGADVQAGEFVTPYIATTTVAVARAADDCTSTDLTWLDDPDTLVGTYFIQVMVPVVGGTVGKTIFELGVHDDRYHFLLKPDIASDGKLRFKADSTTGAAGVRNMAVPSDGVLFRAAGAYQQDEIAGSMDGTSYGVGSSMDVPISVTPITMYYGSSDAGAYLNGYLQKLQYYDERLPSTSVDILSAGGSLGGSNRLDMGIKIGIS